MTETPAAGVRGFVLWPAGTDRPVFRVYGPDDPATGHKTFTDYAMIAGDTEVEVLDADLALYADPADPGKNRLDWNSVVLGDHVE